MTLTANVRYWPLLLCLWAASPALAQDPPPGPDEPPETTTPPPAPAPGTPGPRPGEPAGPPPSNAELDRRLRALEQEPVVVYDVYDDEDWQLQLRVGWFNLAHNHRDEVRKRNGHQNGWAVGIGLDIPLLTELGREGHDDHPFPDDHAQRDGDVDGLPAHHHHEHRYHAWDEDRGFGADFLMHLSLEYRQIEGDDHYNSIVNGSEGEISYLNLVAAPKLRLEVTPVFRPFLLAGLNVQLVSPAEDEDSDLDLGFLTGLGFDLRLHEHLSLGIEYRYTWFGVADQEDEDYGQLTLYMGMNF